MLLLLPPPPLASDAIGAAGSTATLPSMLLCALVGAMFLFHLLQMRGGGEQTDGCVATGRRRGTGAAGGGGGRALFTCLRPAVCVPLFAALPPDHKAHWPPDSRPTCCLRLSCLSTRNPNNSISSLCSMLLAVPGWMMTRGGR